MSNNIDTSKLLLTRSVVLIVGLLYFYYLISILLSDQELAHYSLLLSINGTAFILYLIAFIVLKIDDRFHTFISYFLIVTTLMLLTFVLINITSDPLRIIWFYPLLLYIFFVQNKYIGLAFSGLIASIFIVSFTFFELDLPINTLTSALLSLLLLTAIAYYILEKIERDAKLIKSQLDYNIQFMENTVHHINTPLTIIKLNLELLQENSTLVEEEKVSFVRMNNSIDKLIKMNNNMSQVVSQKKLYLEPELIDLSDALEKSIDDHTNIANTNNIKINKNISPNIKTYINKDDLEILLDNNITNGIKYAPVDSELDITLKMIDNKPTLCFASAGEKITNKDIFSRYQRDRFEGNGLGLGLDIVNEICIRYEINIRLSYINNKNSFCYTFSS